MNTLLLIILLIGHWLGDFTHLSTPDMLAAKRFGTPLMPIWIHTSVHALLTFYINLMFVSDMQQIAINVLILWISHFCIDVLKGKLNKWFPILQDSSKYPHWYVFGLDQLAHTLIIILIVKLS